MVEVLMGQHSCIIFSLATTSLTFHGRKKLTSRTGDNSPPSHEAEECTFQPRINPHAKSRKPRSVWELSAGDAQRHNRMIELKRAAAAQENVAGCADCSHPSLAHLLKRFRICDSTAHIGYVVLQAHIQTGDQHGTRGQFEAQ
ncbi:MAG: hypothetical protein SGPRY_011915, partial [Prymnesium sp.]